LSRNLRKRRIDSLKNFFVELLAFIGFEEASNGPSKTEAPYFLKEVLVD
jgi:hypothetical protein